MTVIRRESNIDWAELQQRSQVERSIKGACLEYVTDLTTTRDQVVADALFVPWGAALLDSEDNPTGLYVQDWNLKYVGADGNVRLYRQDLTLSTIRPERPEQDPDPLERGVQLLSTDVKLERMASVIDMAGQAVATITGEWLTNFNVNIPVRTIRLGINLDAIPSWAINMDGTVNSVDVTIGPFAVPVGTGLLRVGTLPLQPKVENNVEFFPISFSVSINPMGWHEETLQQSWSELVYTDANGDEVTTAQIVANEYTDVSVRKILGDDAEPKARPSFIDRYGRYLKVTALNNVPIGTVTTEAGSRNLTAIAPFEFTDDYAGLGVLIRRQSDGRSYRSTIDGVLGAGTAQLPVGIGVPFDSTASDLYIPGIATKTLRPYPSSPWTGVPFSNE